jgi:hypothetical protein
MTMDDIKAGQSAHHPAGHGGHEKRDVTFRPIVWAAAGMLVVTVLVFLGVWWTLDYYAGREAQLSPAANPLTSSYGRQQPPEPRLQTKPVQDLRQMRTAEDAVLNTYGWVDQKAGTVRIPIARAMELLAQRGLPARPESGATP